MSNMWSVAPVMSLVSAAAPRSILDVGVGFGKYGFLCREALELGAARYARADWQVRIEGIEVFERYRTPVWDYVYDRIHIGAAEELLAPGTPIGDFDLALFCDVIEHFEKSDGQRVLDLLLDRCRMVLVTTPVIFFMQSDAFDNEHERHLSHFSPLDFRELHHLWWVSGPTLIVLASRNPLPPAVRAAALSSTSAGLRGVARGFVARGRQYLHDHLPDGTRKRINQVLAQLGLR